MNVAGFDPAVMSAQAGIQAVPRCLSSSWMPAFADMAM